MPSHLLPALLAAIFLPVLILPAVLAAGGRLRARTGWLALTAPLVSTAILAWIVAQSGTQPRVLLEAPWIPMLGLNFSFLVDGLSIFYGFVICGIGVLVCWYAAEYLGAKYASHGRFYAYLLLFMTAMLGTVFSNNLLLLFIFWELTGVASFLLIGFFHEKAESRRGARQALIITAATGLCLLAGLIMLGLSSGTYSLAEMTERGLPGGRVDAWIQAACVLLLLGAFGKSAQFPFHFWLPGAMAAPTPVSAYLHSATMVKLGVFLTARLFPIFQSLELWFWLVCGIGFFTMLVGAFLALRSNDLKAILAYSTVSQLGFLIGAYGLGSRTGVQTDFVHVLSHVLYKGSLFMTAGIVDHCTGLRDVRRLGGLGRFMPVTAFSAAVGAAALAGLPFTTGFISKEILLTDLVSAEAWGWFSLVGISAIFTVAFAARLFFNVFTGLAPADLTVKRPGWSIQLPPFLLAAAALVLGTFPGALDGMVNGLKVAGLHAAEPVHLALWHGFNLTLFATMGILAAGAGLYFWAQKTHWRFAVIPRGLQFDAGFERGLEGLSLVSKKLTLALRADWPPAYLPILISFLLAALVAAAAISPTQFFAGFSGVRWNFDPLRTLVAVLIMLTLIGVVRLRRWTTQLIALSGAGFFLTFYFILYRAPDLAMTQILVESASVIMILLLLSRFPSSQLVIRSQSRQGAGHVFRIALSAGIGTAVFLLLIFASLHRHPDPIGPQLLALSEPLAEGTNAVNTILVDFRGFDTLGEITVLLIATLGALGLMMRYKRGNTGKDPAPPPGFFLGDKQ
jgi:NADH:ubiquinone oxidoreductase subunit 5 (subunit L)/multisubunit Na+/H+ antiporter MnhA subunit